MTFLRLLAADLVLFFRGRLGNLLSVGCTLVLGAHFTLLGAQDHREFFAFTYIYFPTLFLTLSALAVSWERHTRLSDVILAAPLTRTAYFAGKAVGVLILGGAYLVLTLPFAFVFAWLAGWAWLPDIAYHMGLGALVIVATSSLGLLLSVLFSHRGFLPAVFTGFTLSIVFTQWGFLVRIIRNIVPPMRQGDVLRLLVVSPAYVAANASPLFRAVDAPSPSSLVLASLGFSLLCGLLGLLAFVRLQNATTWDAPLRLRAGFAAVLLLAPGAWLFANPEGDLAEFPPAPNLQGGFVDPVSGVGFSISNRLWGLSAGDGPPERPVLRAAGRDPWVVHFNRAESASYTLHNVTLRLRSEDLHFNQTVFRFGTVHVPSQDQISEFPGPEPPWRVVPAVEVIPLRMDAAYEVGKSWFNYTLESDGHIWASDQYVVVRPPAAQPFVYPVILTGVLALGFRLLWWQGGWRR